MTVLRSLSLLHGSQRPQQQVATFVAVGSLVTKLAMLNQGCLTG